MTHPAVTPGYHMHMRTQTRGVWTLDTFVGMRIGACIDMCVCVCVDMSMHMCIGMCITCVRRRADAAAPAAPAAVAVAVVPPSLERYKVEHPPPQVRMQPLSQSCPPARPPAHVHTESTCAY